MYPLLRQDVSSKLIYELEVTNLDDVVSFWKKILSIKSTTTRKCNAYNFRCFYILLESIGVPADETTTLTATVSASTAGSADIASLTISGGQRRGQRTMFLLLVVKQ